jgi:hypothetical protein
MVAGKVQSGYPLSAEGSAERPAGLGLSPVRPGGFAAGRGGRPFRPTATERGTDDRRPGECSVTMGVFWVRSFGWVTRIPV